MPSGAELVGTLDGEPHHTTLGVSDPGTGIMPNQLPYIFVRFSRAGLAQSTKFRGNRIGLGDNPPAISEAHPGEITVYRDGIGLGTGFAPRGLFVNIFSSNLLH